MTKVVSIAMGLALMIGFAACTALGVKVGVVWQLRSEGLALVGKLHDFTQEEFIALAESVKPSK